MVLRGGHVDIQVGEVVVGIVRIGLADRLGVIALEFLDLLLVQVHHRVELDVEQVHGEERDGDDGQQGDDERRRTAFDVEVERHVDDLVGAFVEADAMDIVDRRIRRLLLRIDTREKRGPQQMRERHLVEGVVDQIQFILCHGTVRLRRFVLDHFPDGIPIQVIVAESLVDQKLFDL